MSKRQREPPKVGKKEAPVKAPEPPTPPPIPPTPPTPLRTREDLQKAQIESKKAGTATGGLAEKAQEFLNMVEDDDAQPQPQPQPQPPKSKVRVNQGAALTGVPVRLPRNKVLSQPLLNYLFVSDTLSRAQFLHNVEVVSCFLVRQDEPTQEQYDLCQCVIQGLGAEDLEQTDLIQQQTVYATFTSLFKRLTPPANFRGGCSSYLCGTLLTMPQTEAQARRICRIAHALGYQMGGTAGQGPYLPKFKCAQSFNQLIKLQSGAKTRRLSFSELQRVLIKIAGIATYQTVNRCCFAPTKYDKDGGKKDKKKDSKQNQHYSGVIFDKDCTVQDGFLKREGPHGPKILHRDLTSHCHQVLRQVALQLRHPSIAQKVAAKQNYLSLFQYDQKTQQFAIYSAQKAASNIISRLKHELGPQVLLQNGIGESVGFALTYTFGPRQQSATLPGRDTFGVVFTGPDTSKTGSNYQKVYCGFIFNDPKNYNNKVTPYANNFDYCFGARVIPGEAQDQPFRLGLLNHDTDLKGQIPADTLKACWMIKNRAGFMGLGTEEEQRADMIKQRDTSTAITICEVLLAEEFIGLGLTLMNMTKLLPKLKSKLKPEGGSGYIFGEDQQQL